MGFLSPDKNTRSTVTKSISSTSRDLSYNTAVSQILNLGMFMETNLFKIYTTSLNEWGSDVSIQKSTSTNLTLPTNHSPMYSNNPSWSAIYTDKANKNIKSETPAIFRGKEELAPDYIFSTY